MKTFPAIVFASLCALGPLSSAVEPPVAAPLALKRPEPITQLRGLCLETDLRKATLVVGSNPAHPALAQLVSRALSAVTGRPSLLRRDVEVVSSLPFPSGEPIIVLGNLADNLVIRRLYLEMFCFVDRAFPGPQGYLLQTIHNPWGTGQNVIVLGASDDVGLQAAVDAFGAHVRKGPVIGRLYDIKPSERFDFARRVDDRAEKLLRTTLPLLWPHAFQLGYNEAAPPAILYFVTGEDRYARRAREEMLKQVKEGLCKHLYFLPRPILWNLLETHPCFSDPERLTITNWLLDQLRSEEGIRMSAIWEADKKELLGNHGSRTAIGCFFAARYFRDRYGLEEANSYLERLERYFQPQETISQPICDSSAHQWGGTIEDQAIYALASGNLGFFRSGAARRAADRALAITSPLGHVADVSPGFGANSFLATAAFVYQDGRYKWAHELRTEGDYGSDELMRTFADDLPVVPPRDLVGVTVVPWDRGTWDGYARLASNLNYTLPNIPFEKAFNKIAIRTDLTAQAEFLLLDGMVGASHDPDSVHVVHEYARGGRIYLTHRNTLDILHDGLSSTLPSCAELIHAGAVGPAMISQTRLNDYGDADWTRTLVLLPGGFMAVIERVTARQPGEFTLTSRWHALGKPLQRDDTLTLQQFPVASEGEARKRQTTFFQVQAPGERVWTRSLRDPVLLKQYRGYPYASGALQQLNQSKRCRLAAGESEYLYTLMHQSPGSVQGTYRMALVAPGVVHVSDGQRSAYVGAPAGPVTIGGVTLDADAFYLDDAGLSVTGGRHAVIDGETVLASTKPVTRTLPWKSPQLTAQLASKDHDRRFETAQPLPESPKLAMAWQIKTGGEVHSLRSDLPEGFGVVAVPVGWGSKGKAGNGEGKVLFLDAAGKTVRALSAEARVNDVAVADLDGDGKAEVLLALEDCSLMCLANDGRPRFRFRPKQEKVISPSNTWLQKNSAQRVWVVDATGQPGRTIVVSTGDQCVHGLNTKGERVWLSSSRPGIASVLATSDVDGDGRPDLLVGNREISNAGILWILNGKDQPQARFIPRTGDRLNAVVAADLNGDGRDEVLVATSSLACLDPRTLDVRWVRAFGDEVRGLVVLPASAGAGRIVAASRNEFVVAFDAAGRRQWATPAGVPVEFLFTLRRGNEVLLAAVGATGRVVVLSAAGQVRFHYDLGAAPRSAAVPAARPDLLCVATADDLVTALTFPMR